MSNITIFSADYKSLAAEKLRNHYRSLLIGTFSMSLLVSFAYFYISRDINNINPFGLFATNNTLKDNSSVAQLSKMIREKNMNNITPVASSSATPSSAGVTENGQITAIATSQVTYVKNKYTVQLGDSISSIALQVYGDVNAWPRIAQANNLATPESIEPGMVLVIPR
ncbi:hypothetical protein BH09PAT2_BH09PAT2_09420 [soil metagenome]